MGEVVRWDSEGIGEGVEERRGDSEDLVEGAAVPQPPLPHNGHVLRLRGVGGNAEVAVEAYVEVLHLRACMLSRPCR